MAEMDSLIVGALPKDGHAWRIDWFGNLAFPNRMIRRTQTSMLLHFSRVCDDPYDPTALLSASSTNTHYQRKAWVSIGSLGLFRVGDIWRNGQFEAHPDYQLETFDDLLIDKSTTTIVKAGLSPDGERFLLPLEDHPWHRNNTHSYCLTVNLPDDKRLIIPCYELIRFYFGSSSNLLAQFFRPPLNRTTGRPKMYSMNQFGQSEIVMSMVRHFAMTQVRWLKIPGTTCEGLIVRERDRQQFFVPIVVSKASSFVNNIGDFSLPFKVGDFYPLEELFWFIRDNNLLRRNIDNI